MFGIPNLLSAVSALTANILALAGTVGEINNNLRQRLALDDLREQPLDVGELAAIGATTDDQAEADSNGKTASRRGRRK